MANTTAWEQIADGRTRLYEYLSQLPEASWQKRSRRTNWTVKQLTAHIILESNYTWPVILRYVIQARFDTNRFMDLAARHLAETNSIQDLLEKLRQNIVKQKVPRNISPEEALIDLWIHEQDIAEAITGKSKLSDAQISYILAFVSEHPNSYGLKVMGLHQKISQTTYQLTDRQNLKLGSGQELKRLTTTDLFAELIGLKLT